MNSTIAPIKNTLDSFYQKYTFSPSALTKASLNSPISLSENGDFIQFYVDDIGTIDTIHNQQYAFTTKSNYAGAAIGISNSELTISSKDGTWISGNGDGYGSISINLKGKTVKIAYENNKINVYANNESIHQFNSQPVLEISGFGMYLPGSSERYWDGVVSNIIVNGNKYDIDSNSNDSTIQAETIGTFLTEDEQKELQVAENIGELLGDLKWGIKLNGVNSYFELKENIILSTNGDSLEIGLWTNEKGLISNTGNHGYSFAKNPILNGIGLGVSTTSFALRLDEVSGWPILKTSMSPISNQTIRVEYVNNTIEFYRNGNLEQTYNGQGTMTLSSFGHGSDTYGYWSGIIYYIKVNGEYIDLVNQTVRHNAEIYRDSGIVSDENAHALLQPIKIVGLSDSDFHVYVLNRSTGKYLIHTFHHYYGTNSINGNDVVTWDIWNADSVLDENGENVFQGNINMIYKIGKVNGVDATTEGYHVGSAHGCEVAIFTKCFADGKEFDPSNISGVITCSTFRFVLKSKCYVVDSTHDTGNINNYPAIDEENNPIIHAYHYIDATYQVDNIIKHYNRLVQVRDASVQYIMLAGAMVQKHIRTGLDIQLNDLVNSWNHVELNNGGSSYPTYSAPTGYESIGFDSKHIAADTVIMYGENQICRNQISHVANKFNGHFNVYTHSNQNNLAKCYLNAVGVINSQGLTIDTLQKDDIVEVYVERNIEVK